mgnify:CR=1 FL=1
MAPKKKQNENSRRSQNNRTHVIAIECKSVHYSEHLVRNDESINIPQIMDKLEFAYKDNKESLRLSLLHMIVRLCGLTEAIPTLTQLTSDR